VRIFDNPTRKQLSALQQVLANDRDAGLIDIWAVVNPLYLVAEENGELVGVASINQCGLVAELHKLYVAPLHRRKGIGDALLRHAIRRLRGEGVAELMVETIEGSEAWWNRRAAVYPVNRYGYDKLGIVLADVEDHVAVPIEVDTRECL
jgi:GNAT superfamily N-acetyltransferase